MATEELKDFVEERLLAYDPDIDLSEGAPAQDQVVDPIVRRFATDPFEMEVETFISTRLTQEFPDVNFREGSGVRDLLVKAAQILLDPISREVQLIKQQQSMANPDLLAASEADSLAANLFVSRTTGALSTGRVRLFFNAPVAMNISVSNIVYTAGGLRFLPTTLQNISAEAMIFNQSGSLYYLDISVTAEAAGEDYNVEAGQVVGITNLTAAVRVTNLERFEGGLPEESTEDLISRAEVSITERSLVVGRGVAARLYDQFEDLVHLQVVGMEDEEMTRDIIRGGDMGPVLLAGNDGWTEDDGDGDSITTYFKTRQVDFVAELFDSEGQVENYYLTVARTLWGFDAVIPVTDLNHLIAPGADFTTDDVNRVIHLVKGDPANIGVFEILEVHSHEEITMSHAASGVVDFTDVHWILNRPPTDHEIDSVLGQHELKLADPLPVDREALTWTVRKKELTLSDIPGGITFQENVSNIVIQSDEIHIGGHSDFYVVGTTVQAKEFALPAIADESPLLRDITLRGDTTYPEFVYDPGRNFPGIGVRVGQSLVIESGNNAGTRTIIRVGVKPDFGAPGSDANWLQVDDPITSIDLAMRFRIVDDIDIDLIDPKTVRGEGVDGQTVQLGQLFTTAASIDFVAIGTEVGDTLALESGNDEGRYIITAISGVGNTILEFDAQTSSTTINLEWKVFKAHEGLSTPLVRVRGVDILDSSSQPTGDTVPYAEPIDARSQAFSNAGRGTKLAVSDAITGIVGTVDLEGGIYPLGTVRLGVSINGAAYQNVDISGAVSTVDLINKINGEIPNIGGTLLVDGETRLILRSYDRWLRVEPHTGTYSLSIDTVGLDGTLGEDNRQIKTSGSVGDFTSASFDLKAEKDSVSVLTGDNIGFLFLVSVSTERILVVGFDEDAGRCRFLHPNVGVRFVVGNRSYGKARVYFIDPTSFEVRGAWRPSLLNTADQPANKAITEAGTTLAEDELPRAHFITDVSGATMRFFPDPDMIRQVIPTSSEDSPDNLTSDGTSLVESITIPTGDLGKNSREAAVNFLVREIKAGDLLEIPYHPLQGSVDIRDTGSGGALTYPDDLENTTIILSIDGSIPKTLTFSDQLTDEDSIIDEINDFFGVEIAFVEEVSGPMYLRLEGDYEFVLHGNGTSNTVLGLPTSTMNNKAPADIDGYYLITNVGDPADPTNKNFLDLDQNATAGQAQSFRVMRPGSQRISSTDMDVQLENGLYYMDVELVSEGVGDEWNLDPDARFEMENYDSDGYRLVVADTNMTYSIEELITMNLTRRVLTVGSTDRPDEATPLHSQNIQINYDRSPLASSVQSFAQADLERVLCANILVRHLMPHYVNIELLYRGGSGSDVVLDDIYSHLSSLDPDEALEVSDIQNLALRRGATYIRNPMEIVAVVHDLERKISVERSEDSVTKGRLATFFPGTLSVTRETT